MEKVFFFTYVSTYESSYKNLIQRLDENIIVVVTIINYFLKELRTAKLNTCNYYKDTYTFYKVGYQISSLK